MSDAEATPDDAAAVVVEETPGRARRCIARRLRADPRAMLRFVLDPEDRLVFDADARLPGRGLWLSADGEAIKKAVTQNLFAKAARQRVQVDPDLRAQLVEQLEARCLSWLGLARRAGAIEIGFDQVERAAREDRLAVLVVARDAGVDGPAKLDRFGLPLLRGFASQDMGAALGRPALVYCGLSPGRLAERLLLDARRLQGLRGEETPVPPGKDDDHGAGTGSRQRG